MKTLLILISLLATVPTCLSQTPRPLTTEDSLKIETEVRLAAKKLKSDLEHDQGTSYLALHNEFVLDTFKIEKRQRLRLEIDYSTNGMVISTLDPNREYDQLLNKYYQRLLTSLNEKDREVLRQTQRNWIAFRDSEWDLNKVVMADYYSGGGTMQRVLAAARVLELTRNRTIEMLHYLFRKAA